MKTLDEVIEALEVCRDLKIDCDRCPYGNMHRIDLERLKCIEGGMYPDTLHYLREYKKYTDTMCALPDYYEWVHSADNPPLDWDELKQMVGKPVWVEEKYSFCNDWHGNWEVISSVLDDEWDDDPYLCMTNKEYRHKDYMGERWQAYRKER